MIIPGGQKLDVDVEWSILEMGVVLLAGIGSLHIAEVC